jgi:hypothetical protein
VRPRDGMERGIAARQGSDRKVGREVGVASDELHDGSVLSLSLSLVLPFQPFCPFSFAPRQFFHLFASASLLSGSVVLSPLPGRRGLVTVIIVV